MSEIKRQSHVLHRQGDGVRCATCGRVWSRPPSSPCPGLPQYGYGEWPKHLLTQKQCQDARLTPGPVAAVCPRSKSPGGWLRLYDRNQATAKKPLTQAQIEGREKREQTAKANRTCERCKREWPEKRHIRRGLCPDCRLGEAMRKDRQQAITWARDLLSREFVILDCETTGLWDSEIIQIGVVDKTGTVLLNTYVKPREAIDEAGDAFRVNGITQTMVENAPAWKDVCSVLRPLLTGKTVVAYNVEFDRRMVEEMCRWNCLHEDIAVERWTCAMENYAEFHQEERRRAREYKWQSLWDACRQMQSSPRPGHDAAGDCLATLGLIRALAAVQPKEEDFSSS